MPTDFQQLIDLIPQMTTSVAVVISLFFLYKGGLLTAMTSWMTKTPGNQRINELEAFRSNAEDNHFHDIEDLKEDKKEVWKALNLLQRDIAKISADVANINGRLNNGYKYDRTK